MAVTKLFEDWEDYDNRKLRGGSDARLFSCDEAWEVYYLKKKIQDKYPSLGDGVVLDAIGECCKNVRAPRPRKEFVECVSKRLGISME